ncbi:MAG: hypothetical protein J3R72DRAFT_183756 [Linnemannia gamsii]|nr:MAG: hypothetical protein J3R72DRAFT_183756 [Linnemannia gamsii]
MNSRFCMVQSCTYRKHPSFVLLNVLLFLVSIDSNVFSFLCFGNTTVETSNPAKSPPFLFLRFTLAQLSLSFSRSSPPLLLPFLLLTRLLISLAPHIHTHSLSLHHYITHAILMSPFIHLAHMTLSILN